MKLPAEFYQRKDPLRISRELLGKYLVTRVDGEVTAGKIVEVEAYAGEGDRASHAHGGRRTARTEVMFARGGVAYVYLCYGVHQMMNVVTNASGIPHAILIRGVEPAEGTEIMLRRRKMTQVKRSLTAGPGALAQALGIHTHMSGYSLLGDDIWIEDRGIRIPASGILASPRVGVGYAGEDALLPYRFRVKDSDWTSPAETKY